MIDLTLFIDKYCAFEMRDGSVIWTYILRASKPPGEFDLRVENGWYEAYNRDGSRFDLIAGHVHLNGVSVAIAFQPGKKDIVAVTPCSYEEFEQKFSGYRHPFLRQLKSI